MSSITPKFYTLEEQNYIKNFVRDNPQYSSLGPKDLKETFEDFAKNFKATFPKFERSETSLKRKISSLVYIVHEEMKNQEVIERTNTFSLVNLGKRTTRNVIKESAIEPSKIPKNEVAPLIPRNSGKPAPRYAEDSSSSSDSDFDAQNKFSSSDDQYEFYSPDDQNNSLSSIDASFEPTSSHCNKKIEKNFSESKTESDTQTDSEAEEKYQQFSYPQMQLSQSILPQQSTIFFDFDSSNDQEI